MKATIVSYKLAVNRKTVLQHKRKSTIENDRAPKCFNSSERCLFWQIFFITL